MSKRGKNCRFGGCGDPTCSRCGRARSERGTRFASPFTEADAGWPRTYSSPLFYVDVVDRGMSPFRSSPFNGTRFPGCGNLGCPICNKGRDDDQREAKQDENEGREMKSDNVETLLGFSSVADAVRKEIFRNFEMTFDNITIPISNVSLETPQAKSAQAAGAKPSPEEMALREKVKAYFLETKHQIGWDDVVGNEAARAALLEAIEEPVTHKELYGFYGRKASKGVLLYGAPGCGKTMFGKAAAAAIARIYGSDDVPLLKINGPEIQTPFVGQTEAIIRSIFAYARAFAKRTGRPLVIFIDEADSLLPSRDGTGGRRATSWEESQVAAFLAEMDGLETSGAFVILATNRPHAIDAAVLRDGRCDRKIKVVRPDEAAAKTIISKALVGIPLAEGVSVEGLASGAVAALFDDQLRIARITHSRGNDFLTLGSIVSGAMLVGLVERAKGLAFRRDRAAGTRSGVMLADLEAAIGAVFAENARLSHYAAVEDLAERWDVTITSVEPYRSAA